MRKILFLLLISNYASLLSQTQFQVSIDAGNGEQVWSIVQTKDSGYAAAGTNGWNAYIIKLDASLSLQWTRIMSSGPFGDVILSIVQTTDGGYAGAGSNIFKFDANGTLQWSENISAEASSIIQTNDGGYAVAGETSSFGAGHSDVFIVKLGSSGVLEWARTVGGGGDDLGFSIIQTLDGKYAVAGWTSSFMGGGYILLIKLNSSGMLEWAKAIGSGNENVESFAIQTSDGGYLLGSTSAAFDSSSHFPFHIAKIDGSGALQWSRTVSLRDGNILQSIMQTADGGYAVAGYAMGIEAPPDMYIVKLSSNGTLQWSRTVGRPGDDDRAHSIIRTIDGGYAAAGNGGPALDMYIAKFDSNWNTCGSNDSMVTSFSWGTRDTVITVTPTVTSPTGFITPRFPNIGSGGTLTRICVTGIQPISNEIPVSFKLYQNYPNPFNSKSKIKFQIPKMGDVKLEIFDVLGREITTLVNEALKPGTYEAEWDGQDYPSGVYFYRLEAMPDGRQAGNEFLETRKLVLLK